MQLLVSGSSLKSSLAEIWRKVQLFAETHDLVSPDQRVVDELRAQGWKYEEQTIVAPACHPGAAITIHDIQTPEGTPVKPGTPERKRFNEARAEAARKVFAPPAPPAPGPA